MSRFLLIYAGGVVRRTEKLNDRHLRQVSSMLTIFDVREGLELSSGTDGQWQPILEERDAKESDGKTTRR